MSISLSVLTADDPNLDGLLAYLNSLGLTNYFSTIDLLDRAKKWVEFVGSVSINSVPGKAKVDFIVVHSPANCAVESYIALSGTHPERHPRHRNDQEAV
jgi:hypothetical protein